MANHVRLWCHPEAIELIKILKNRGYPVTRIVTGARVPCAEIDGRYISGFRNIMETLTGK